MIINLSNLGPKDPDVKKPTQKLVESDGSFQYLEQSNPPNQSMAKDPFYGQLFKMLKKRKKKGNLNINGNVSSDNTKNSNGYKTPEVIPKKAAKISADHQGPSQTKIKKESSSKDRVHKNSSSKSREKSSKDRDHRQSIKKETLSLDQIRQKTLISTISNMSYTYSSREAESTVANFSFKQKIFRHLIHINTHPNGRATTLHAYQDEIEAHLDHPKNHYSKLEKIKFIEQFHEDFAQLTILERHVGEPYFVLGVIHNAAKDLEDPLYVMARDHGSTMIKTEKIDNEKDISTISIRNYFRACRQFYNSSSSTTRYGPMRAVSMVGKTGEEVAIYHEEYIQSMEKIPLLKAMLPWGKFSIYADDPEPLKSNDGPILWTRPGEQIFQTAGEGKTLTEKRRKVLVGKDAIKKIKIQDEMDNSGSNSESEPTNSRNNSNAASTAVYPGFSMITATSGRSRGAREKIITDFTPVHGDHVDEAHLRQTGWAVAVLKAPNYTIRSGPNKAVKRVIAFDARSYYDMIEPMEMDMMRMPCCQSKKFIDHQRLTLLRSQGIKYSEFDLYHNDIYIIPRYCMHQFRSIAHVASMAWHIRIRDLHLKDAQELEETRKTHAELNLRRQEQLLNILETDKKQFFSSDEEFNEGKVGSNRSKTSSPKKRPKKDIFTERPEKVSTHVKKSPVKKVNTQAKTAATLSSPASAKKSLKFQNNSNKNSQIETEASSYVVLKEEDVKHEKEDEKELDDSNLMADHDDYNVRDTSTTSDSSEHEPF